MKAEILQKGRKCAEGEKPAGSGTGEAQEKEGARCVAALSRISAQRMTVKGENHFEAVVFSRGGCFLQSMGPVYEAGLVEPLRLGPGSCTRNYKGGK